MENVPPAADAASAAPPRSRFRGRAGWLAGGALVALGIGLVMPVVEKLREAGDRMQ